MTRRLWFRIAPAIGLLAALAAGSARAQDPPRTTGEKIKDRVGGAIDSIKRGTASAGEAIKEQYGKAKAAVGKMGVEARVYSRLHWDKALQLAKIDLSAPSNGVIALTGTVPDAKARAKAIELTRDTIGVTEVIDHLTIGTTTEGAAEVIKPSN